VDREGSVRIRVWLVLGLLVLSATLQAGEVRVFFSPRGGCEEAILEQINHAKSYIHVAMYAFTSRYLSRALVDAKEKGVEVLVVLDTSFNTENKYSKTDYLKRKGIPVKFVTPHARMGMKVEDGLMHHKFVVIDGEIVVTGSYNWTARAENVNYENLLIFVGAPELAQAYEREFQRLWR